MLSIIFDTKDTEMKKTDKITNKIIMMIIIILTIAGNICCYYVHSIVLSALRILTHLVFMTTTL